MRINFFEVSPDERPFLKKLRLPGATIALFEKPMHEAPASDLKGTDVASVFIYSKVDKGTLSKSPKLRFVATRSTGFDHIDLATCEQRRIAVSNVPYYGENTVAEHTFALILALSRKVHQAHVRAQRGDFSFDGLMGFDLKGKSIGVVGTGHIGLHVIRIAKGFGMRVVGFDVFPNHFMAETLGFDYVAFDDLLGHSDIISLHAPYRKETHHLINKDNIKKIKRGALLINTARGGLVESGALVQALDEGILGGAGLDVLEGEDLIKEERQILTQDFPADRMKMMLQNHILMNRENVVLTPHIAFNSREAAQRILDTTVSNIQAFLAARVENAVKSPAKK
ncbi:MAG: hydroxyacid dehydrogenase [Elusimicrobia bacterium]|nr:hydroxyacid dehydrogenase [Elusimicrobiota bacterium]